ncbi:MAG: SAM-dependent methyltransferase, partial [Acidimicrobiales bacterium]
MSARIVVVGLGPGDPGLVTAATLGAIDRMAHRYVRTTRHPSAPLVAGAVSFDHHYEAEATFDDVYRRIAEDLVAAAKVHGEVLYAVPGSPMVLERSVEHLLSIAADPATGVEVEVLAATSFLDLVWVRLGVDPFGDGVRLVDAHRFAERAAGERGPLLVAHCHNQRVLSDIKLAVTDFPPVPVTVLQRLGTEDEAVFTVAWEDLDRSFEPDHLTAVWIPELATPVAAELQALVGLVSTLRERCPWDREQTHHSLTRHLLEETYEVLEALGALPPGADGSHDAYPHVE